MPAPTFTRPIQGTAPNQFVENTADVAALNATLEALWLAIVSGGSEQQVADLVNTLTGLRDAAQTAETGAVTAQGLAEAARDAAFTSGEIADDVEAGVAGAEIGGQFFVISEDGLTLSRYQVLSGLLDPELSGAVTGSMDDGGALPDGWQRPGSGITDADVEVVSITEDDGLAVVRVRIDGESTGTAVAIAFAPANGIPFDSPGVVEFSIRIAQKAPFTNIASQRLQILPVDSGGNVVSGGDVGSSFALTETLDEYFFSHEITNTDAVAWIPRLLFTATSPGPVFVDLEISGTRFAEFLLTMLTKAGMDALVAEQQALTEQAIATSLSSTAMPEILALQPQAATATLISDWRRGGFRLADAGISIPAGISDFTAMDRASAGYGEARDGGVIEFDADAPAYPVFRSGKRRGVAILPPVHQILPNPAGAGAAVGRLNAGGALPTGWARGGGGLTDADVEVTSVRDLGDFTAVRVLIDGTLTSTSTQLWFSGNTAIPITPPVNLATTAFIARMAPSTNISTVRLTNGARGAGGAVVSGGFNGSSFSGLSEQLTRYQAVGEITSEDVQFVRPGLLILANEVGAISLDLEIYVPNVTTTPAARPPVGIPGPATVGGDRLTIPIDDEWFGRSAGRYRIEFTREQLYSDDPVVLQVDAGSDDDCLRAVILDTGVLQVQMIEDGAVEEALDVGVVVPGVSQVLVIDYQRGEASGVVRASLQGSTPAEIPERLPDEATETATTLRVGSSAVGDELFGTVQSLTVWDSIPATIQPPASGDVTVLQTWMGMAQ